MTVSYLKVYFPNICGFTEKEGNSIKYISGYVINTLYCRLRKSTEHRSDANMKHMSILLAGKDFLDSSKMTLMSNKEVVFGRFLLVFLKRFVLLRNFLDLMFQTRRERLMLNKWFLH